MFGRKKQIADSGGGAVTTVVAPEGKGRPTPKRRDVERGRRTSVVGGPATGRGARSSARMTARERREAMMRGDESAMLPRDRGPVKRFARDYVDARRSLGDYFIPAAFVIFLVQLVPTVADIALFLMLALFIAVAVQSLGLRRRILAECASRFPGESTRGIVMYAIVRSLQIRRWRFPPPRVKRGASV